MSQITENLKSEIITLIDEGRVSREQIATKVGVFPGTVSTIKTHLRMGRYTEPSEAKEVIEVMETTFGLEHDLQIALQANIKQIKQELKIIDEGKEQTTEAGRIDIITEDKNSCIVVIELKAGATTPDSIVQTLSYIGVLSETQNKPVFGILVTCDFPPRVVFAARAVPNLQLKKYRFRFSFEAVK